MDRLILCGLGLLSALALSFQLPPSAEMPPTLDFEDVPASLPGVSAASLSDTLAYVEGRPTDETSHASERRNTIRLVVEHLERLHTGLSHQEISRVATTIVDECDERDIEPNLVLGVIQVESSGYHRAVSPVGALGLMQIMPATVQQLAQDRGVAWQGPEMLFDPSTCSSGSPTCRSSPTGTSTSRRPWLRTIGDRRASTVGFDAVRACRRSTWIG